jgi:hypothetical protein
VSGVRKREPQNTEQGIMNVEGKKASAFPPAADSIFDIQESGSETQ